MLRLFIFMLGLLSASVSLANPTFSIVPSGILPTVPGSIAYYLVTNNTPYTLKNNGLLPQKNIVQDTSSDCNCSKPFTLGPGQSCTLALDILGLTSGGPTVCNEVNHPARCSTPSEHNLLNVRHRGVLGTNSPPNGILQTVDGGASWEVISFEVFGFSSASCSSDLCVAAGFSLALTETDQTSDAWDNISLGTTNGEFLATSCLGEWCIAVGQQAGVPDIAQRDPTTHDWAFITKPNVWPGGGEFNAAGCGTGLCIAAGDDGAGDFYIAESTNQDWTLPFTQSTPVNVFSASCVGTHCIVVGERYNSTEETINAVLYQRNPTTGVWSDISYDINGLPSGTSFFQAASCSAPICVAVGSSLAQSTDQGKTWSVRASSISGTYEGASCSGNFCVAVGRGSNNQGMIVQTTNAGKSWQVANVTGMPTAINSIFGPVSCTGNFCVVGGSAEKSITEMVPFFAQTTDGGKHWAVVEGVTLPNHLSIYAAATQ